MNVHDELSGSFGFGPEVIQIDGNRVYDGNLDLLGAEGKTAAVVEGLQGLKTMLKSLDFHSCSFLLKLHSFTYIPSIYNVVVR